MNPARLLFLAAALAAQITLANGAAPRAQDLPGRLSALQNDTSLLLRIKITVVDAPTGGRRAAQILVKRRRDGSMTRILYQVLWPASHQGEALYLEKAGAGAASGFTFTPPESMQPLTPDLLGRPYLDSDLSFEDLAEDYWQWPSQEVVGEETINGDLCAIIISCPPPGLTTEYSLIRTWVSIDKTLPLRIEKMGRDRHLRKWFAVQKAAHHDHAWVPVITLVQSADRSRQTTIEFSRASRTAEIPVEDFSLENIKKLASGTTREPKKQD